MKSRLEILSDLKRQVDAGTSVDLALSEAYAEGAASVLSPNGRPPPAATSISPSLSDLAGSLFQAWAADAVPGFLRVAAPTSAADLAPRKCWMSDDPALLPELVNLLAVDGGQVTLEENEAMRLLSEMPTKACTVIGGSFTSAGRDVWWWAAAVIGYRLALGLERLSVALVPGGKRGG